ncbi:MAG: prepilin-type N-terminal cleavage/methylation domain-containing protein [Planctomycetes bacterium]|nr:prepilin-type N-terminal cleavage/methylation domain-containing protein [Planctomycetota bacterium]
MRRPGFTLLEVLIAMCVLVLATAAILPLFAVGTASHKRGMDQTIAALVAQKAFAEIQMGLTSQKPRDIAGARVFHEGQEFRYDATFSRLDAADRTDAAFIVRVAVKWADGGHERTEDFDTILLRRIAR